MPGNSILLKMLPMASAGDDTKAQPISEHDTQIQLADAGESESVDRAVHAALAQFSGGISPVALSLAYRYPVPPFASPIKSTRAPAS